MHSNIRCHEMLEEEEHDALADEERVINTPPRELANHMEHLPVAS